MNFLQNGDRADFPQFALTALVEVGGVEIIHVTCLAGREVCELVLPGNLWQKFCAGSTFLNKLSIHSL